MKLIQAVFGFICLNFFTVSYAAPVVSNLVEPDKYFVNNDSQITDLSTNLSVYRTMGLVGISGIGKTQLARMYAYHNKDKYDLIWSFDSNADLTEQFVELSKAINAEFCKPTTCGLSEDMNKAKKDIIKFLASKSNWLLIFDNLKINQNNKIIDIINWSHNGHVILCSQDSKDLSHSIKIPYLSDRDSMNLADSILEDKNSEMVEELVKTFHGYPILIVQGAIFLNKNKHLTLEEYKQILGKADDKITEHIKLVLTELPETAKELLYKIAALNNQNFSRKLLEGISSKHEIGKDLENITRFGLINMTHNDKDNQRFEMHDAIKESLLRIIGQRTAKKIVIEVIDCLNSLMPKSEDSKYLVMESDKTLKSNFEEILNNAEQYEVDIYKILELRKELMRTYKNALDYYNCDKMSQWLLNSQQKLDSFFNSMLMKDTDKANYAEYLMYIAEYRDFAYSDYLRALKYFKKAKVLAESLKNYLELKFQIYSSLAQVYAFGADFKNTEDLLKVADDIVQNNPSLDLERGFLWFIKSRMYLLQGKYDEALDAINKCKEAYAHFPEGTYTAPIYISKSEILNYMSRFQEAYDTSTKVYKQEETNIKGEHELHARILVQLSRAELGLNKNIEALEHAKKAIDIQGIHNALIGDNVYANSYNMDLAAAYAAYGDALFATGADSKEIIDAYNKASVIYFNRYRENEFKSEDVRDLFWNAAKNLCKLVKKDSVTEKAWYSTYKDKLNEYWPKHPQTLELKNIEKTYNCGISQTSY